MLSQIIRPKAILFDLDGTLISSESVHNAAWRRLFEEKLHLPYREEDFHAMVGRPAPDILSDLLDQYRPGWNPDDYDLNALSLLKNDYYLEMAPSSLHPYPGVREFLPWAQAQGIKMGIVTNARRREMEAALTQLHLIQHFQSLVSRDDARIAKPDPFPYLLGAAELGVSPHECLAFEDSPPGLESALTAKIATIALASNFPEEHLRTPVPGRGDLKPIQIFESIYKAFEWVKTLPVDRNQENR